MNAANNALNIAQSTETYTKDQLIAQGQINNAFTQDIEKLKTDIKDASGFDSSALESSINSNTQAIEKNAQDIAGKANQSDLNDFKKYADDTYMTYVQSDRLLNTANEADKKAQLALDSVKNTVDKSELDNISKSMTSGDAATLVSANDYTNQQVNSVDSKVNTIDSKVNNLTTDLSNSLNNTNNKVDSLESSMNNKIDDMNQTIEQGGKNTLNSANQYTDSQIKGMNETINENFVNQQENNKSQQTQIDGVTNMVINNAKDQNLINQSMNDSIANNTGLIATNADKILNNSNMIQSNTDKIGKVESELSNKVSHETWQSQNDAIDSNMNSMREEYTQQNSYNENNIASNKGEIDNIKADMTNKVEREEMQAVSSQVDTNKINIDRQQQQISSNTQTSQEALGLAQGAGHIAVQAMQNVEYEATQRISGDKKVLSDSKAYTNSKFSELKSTVESNRKKAASGVAGVAAMTNIPALSGNKNFSFGMGVGNFDSESSLAAGFQGRVSENVVTKVSFSIGEETVIGAGAAFEW